MDQSMEDRIRERAYEIWAAQGCVPGRAEQHWLAAEQEILTLAPACKPLPQTPKLARRPSSGIARARTRKPVKSC
jgi:hypothetical protein